MEPIKLSKIFASLPRTERGKFIVIGGDPKNKKNILYTNGKNVIIRDIEDPSVADLYAEHSHNVTVAKYSPSGFYICSGDSTGKVRIWDTTQKEHILKAEYQPLGLEISDIDWTEDSKRIAVAGMGRETFAHAFLMDSGSSVGSLTGVAKKCNAVSIKPTRPYRLVLASEDDCCVFYENVPFKFKCTITDHTKFVNCVRFSPNGEFFISGSADGRAFKYDGKDATKIGEMGNPAHKGGIYGLSFKDDGTEVLTCSGDKTCKIFNTASGDPLVTFNMGSTIPCQQMGCLWQGDNIISVSLSGYINYLDRNNPDTPLRVIKGHNKIINALAIHDGIIYTSSLRATIDTSKNEAHVNWWEADTGKNDGFEGKCHASKVADMVICENELITVSEDDTIMFSDLKSKQFGTSVGLDSQPKAVAAVPGLTVVTCENHVIVFKGHNKAGVNKFDNEPFSVAINGDNKVAIGGKKDKKVHIYTENSGTLKEDTVITDYGSGTGEATDLAFSPNNEYLAMAGGDRFVRLYKLPAYDLVFESAIHNAKVNSIAWSPDSRYFATGSIDSHIAVFCPEKTSKARMEHYQFKNAHKLGIVTRVQWLDNHTLVSTGDDSHVKQWEINF